jgi:acetyl esterase/lipase
MVVTTMLLARHHGLPLPGAGMPLSPWFDFEATSASQHLNAGKYALLNKELGQVLAGMFLGESGNPRDPFVSPLYAGLVGLPPLYIQASSDETLLDDSRLFADRARQAGVDVRVDLFPGQQHTFQMAVGRSKDAAEAMRRLADSGPSEAGPVITRLTTRERERQCAN